MLLIAVYSQVALLFVSQKAYWKPYFCLTALILGLIALVASFLLFYFGLVSDTGIDMVSLQSHSLILIRTAQ